MPLQPATWRALEILSGELLDRVVSEFGSIELTYGFASLALTRAIEGRIAPPLDQHASHELNRLGRPVCRRLGAAADFHVQGVSSRALGRWIVRECGFDRLYFYGDERPLHVSVGPDGARSIVEMRRYPSGRVVPFRASEAAWSVE